MHDTLDMHIRTAADALARDWSGIDTTAHIVGRYSVELPDGTTLKVKTSWLPVQGYYETLVIAPWDVLTAIGDYQRRYYSRRDAEIGHDEMLTRLHALLPALPVAS